MLDVQVEVLAKELQNALCETHPNVVADLKGCKALVDIIERIALAAK